MTVHTKPYFSLIAKALGLMLMSFSLLAAPAKVEVKKIDNQYQVFVNGERFIIKGAGIGYKDGHDFAGLAKAGGNSFRTWDTGHADEELAAAKEHNLMVAMGIDLGKELHHFDYNDEAAVTAQFEKVKGIVDRYKDHPNLLFWVVGNELNLLIKDDGSLGMVNPKAYQAVSDIIDYIHRVDPNHPVTYTFAGAIEAHIKTALAFTPQVDIVSVQVYGDLATLDKVLPTLNIDKPFLVTEFGPKGHWEMPSTTWGREIEEPSGVKAAGFAERMEKSIINDKTGLVIGGYAFEWGQKQERTPTWYGMFNKSGEATARVDELTRIWTGAYPSNRAPLAESISLNSRKPEQSLTVKANQKMVAKVNVTDPDGDPLTIKWVMLTEVGTRSKGGALELEPTEIAIAGVKARADSAPHIEFTAPKQPGQYRLFAYIYDGKGKVGNANFPFLVKK